MNDIVKDAIEREMEAAIPMGEGRVSASRMRSALERVAIYAYREGESDALRSLMTVDEVAARLGVSPQRARALAKDRHARFGIGWQVPGTRTWLFRRSELDLLRPGPEGKPGHLKGVNGVYAVYECYDGAWWRLIGKAATEEGARERLEAERRRRKRKGYSMFETRIVQWPDANPPDSVHGSDLPEAVSYDQAD